MSAVRKGDSGADREALRRRRRSTAEVKQSLRELRSQLSLLNHQVSAGVRLKDIDLDCLELLTFTGPHSPSELARAAGLHPATMTGILDRLQRGGWVVRERDPETSDRRAVTVKMVPGRAGELYRGFAGMNNSLDEICADYSEAELELLAGFLRRTTAAGSHATAKLAGE